MIKNTIKKIIYFIETPFDERDCERFGIDILMQNNLEVRIWELTPCLNPEGYQNIAASKKKDHEIYSLFFSKKEALSAISNLDSSCFVVCLITFNMRSFSIFKMLSKKNIKYSIFRANALPSSSIKKINFNFVYYKFKNINVFKVMNKLLISLPHTMFGLKPAMLLLAGGEKSLSYRYPLAKGVEVLWLHTLDYDIFLRKKELSQINSNVAVFLDEYLPFHSDYIYLGLKPFVTSEKYYSLINKFFNKIENRDSMRVVIAAHPRSNYKEYDELFDGRLIIKSRTFELVRESKLVIAHSSTAINFAILLKKPIIFITTNQLNKSIEGKTIKLITQALGKDPINIDEQFDINLERELIVDERLYDQYKNNYIKKRESEENYFWQIVAKRLKDGFNKN